MGTTRRQEIAASGVNRRRTRVEIDPEALTLAFRNKGWPEPIEVTFEGGLVKHARRLALIGLMHEMMEAAEGANDKREAMLVKLRELKGCPVDPRLAKLAARLGVGVGVLETKLDNLPAEKREEILDRG